MHPGDAQMRGCNSQLAVTCVRRLQQYSGMLVVALCVMTHGLDRFTEIQHRRTARAWQAP